MAELIDIPDTLVWDYRQAPEDLLWRLQRIAEWFPAYGRDRKTVGALHAHLDDLRIPREVTRASTITASAPPAGLGQRGNHDTVQSYGTQNRTIGGPLMPVRTERLEARVAPEEAATIRRAAALENVSTSSFVVSSAVARAEEIIASHQATTVPPEFFERLLRSLKEPGTVVPALARAVKRARRHRR